MSSAVVFTNVSKTYPPVAALDRVSLNLDGGKIHGLIGRNGAGKTTLLHLVAAQILPTAGEIRVFGEPPLENRAVLRHVCLIKENPYYPPQFTAGTVLKTAGGLFPRWDHRLADALANQFGLPLQKRAGRLSLGMRTALGLTIGLASRAPLTVFDEPYLGLDPVARHIFYEQLLEDYGRRPRTVIISTHLIDETSRLFEEIALIDRGKIILSGGVDDILQEAFYLTGAREALEPFLEGKVVLHRESLGGTAAAAIRGRLSGEEKARALRLGLAVESLSLQKLMVYLTSSQRSVN
jgi:ABC-2 type transport system ATP-binding protein